MRTRLIALGGALLLIAACSSDGGTPLFGSQPGGVTTTAGGDGASDTTGATLPDGGGIGDIDEVRARPLPLREGLGTFDNYEWHMEVATVGPTADETSTIVTTWIFNRDPESRISMTSSTQTGPDFDGAETSVTELYQVEGETCQWDGESWTYTSATDQQQEVLDVAQRLFDMTIVPDNPIEVGAEPVAGIPATHWRFAVSGFGSESGALVTANQMDYWVAENGVLLRYEMVIESRSGPTTDPTAEVYRVEASAILISANQSIPVTLAAECLATAGDA